MIFGGSLLGDGTRLEEHVIVGKPEQGYAVGHVYPGAGADTVIGAGAVIRAGAVIYAGAEVGEDTVVGHHTLLRSFVTVGGETQLGHNLTIERATRIGTGCAAHRAATSPAPACWPTGCSSAPASARSTTRR